MPPRRGRGGLRDHLLSEAPAHLRFFVTDLEMSSLKTSPASVPAGSSPTTHQLLPRGSVLGNYVLAAPIGSGTMGMVYRAEHRRLGSEVAIKVMAHALRDDAEERSRFLLEAQTAATLEHPHVVEVIDFGEREADLYFVMELLEGEDLDACLERRTRLSAEETAALVLPIVSALGAAHDAGVVHRDLKPGNIFVHRERDGTTVPKLLDFGISKPPLAVARGDFRSTSPSQILGTPNYLPPEGVNGCRNLTALSDQYSLGVVLYECVTGRAPIERDDFFSLLKAIESGEFVPPSRGVPELPGAMENAILRCMQRRPEQRFAHVRELGLALLDVADATTRVRWQGAFARASVPAISLERRPPPAARRRRRFPRLGAVAAASGAGMLVIALIVTAAGTLARPAPALREFARSTEPRQSVDFGEAVAASWQPAGAEVSDAAASAEAQTATESLPPLPSPAGLVARWAHPGGEAAPTAVPKRNARLRPPLQRARAPSARGRAPAPAEFGPANEAPILE
jgi:hypothetical protein